MNEVGKSPHVQSPKQALAVAYSEQRRAHRADGGRNVQVYRPGNQRAAEVIDAANTQRINEEYPNLTNRSFMPPQGRADGGNVVQFPITQDQRDANRRNSIIGQALGNTQNSAAILPIQPQQKAGGGPIATTMQRQVGDPDFATQASLGDRGLVPVFAQQQFKNGSLGPLNINPKPIQGEQNRAAGGPAGYAGGGLPTAPWFIRRSAQQMAHIGAINSPVAGRTDHIPLNVASGSYVVPADIVSGLGQGNTAAGHQILGRMFKTGPLGMTARPPKAAGSAAPKMPKLSPSPPNLGFGSSSPTSGGFASGGDAEAAQAGPHLVPIMAAGGEHVLSPDQVMAVGDGDIRKGHEALDQWIKIQRQKHVETMKKLPPPAKR